MCDVIQIHIFTGYVFGKTVNIRPSNEQDLLIMLHWFQTEAEVKKWGGPSIHFPLNLEQLKKDIEWESADSYSFVDETNQFVGFSQVFNKFGCKHQ